MTASPQTLPDHAAAVPPVPVHGLGARSRLASLRRARLMGAAVVALAAVLLPDLAPNERIALAVIAATWAGAGMLLLAGQLPLLVDGVAVVASVAVGGAALIALAITHVVVVTILAAQRTGLRIAIWDALLLLAVGVATRGARPEWGDDPVLGIAVTIVALVGVGVATAAAATLNERDLRRTSEQLHVLIAAGAEMDLARTPEAVLDILLDVVMLRLPFAAAAATLDATLAGRALAVRRYEGAMQLEAPGDGRGIAERQLVERVSDVADARIASLLPSARQVLAVPIAAAGVSGTLAVALHLGSEGAVSRAAVTLRTAELVEALATQAARALHRLALRTEVQRFGGIDSVTGVATRQGFEPELRLLLAEAARARRPVAVLLLDLEIPPEAALEDLDHRVAAALLELRRGGERVARDDDGRFALVLPGGTARHAVRVAERTRRAIAALPMGAVVTASVGIAVAPADGSDAAELLAVAGSALAAARAAGGDQVRLAGGRGPSAL